MNQEFKPSAFDVAPPAEGDQPPSARHPDEYRPLLLRRDLIAILPYLNRTEFCRRPGWEQARQVDCGFTKAATQPPVK